MIVHFNPSWGWETWDKSSGESWTWKLDLAYNYCEQGYQSQEPGAQRDGSGIGHIVSGTLEEIQSICEILKVLEQ